MPTVTKTFDGESLSVETYDPSGTDAGLIIVHHGSSRSTYSGGYDDLANDTGLSVFAPIFPESRYGSDEYQRGGVFDDDGDLNPRDEWTTRLEEPIIDWAKTQVENSDPDVFSFGFSAGGQFLNRVVAFDAPEGVDRFIVGSPSTWVLPSLTEDGPYGFDGLGTDAEEKAALQKYLAQPMTIYLGEEDTRTDDNLGDPDNELGQGRNRLERGINTYEMGKDVAADNGWDFNWSLVIADGVGHAGSDMLRAPEMLEAMKTTGTPDDPDDPDEPTPDDPEVFQFSGDFRRNKTETIDELDFGNGDELAFSGYDRGTFWKVGARSASIESLAELKSLDYKSEEVSLSTRGDYDLTIRIKQDQGTHTIYVEDLIS
jgi:hypothetical protein